MKTLRLLSLALAALTSAAGAQGASNLPAAAPGERVMLWAGLSTELLVRPGARLGLSAPLGQVGAASVSLRGTLDTVGLPGALRLVHRGPRAVSAGQRRSREQPPGVARPAGGADLPLLKSFQGRGEPARPGCRTLEA